MHLCIAVSIRAMPEKEKPPAMPVDIYFCVAKNKVCNTFYFVAAVGSYKSEQAVALGAFYRPN